MDSVHRTKLRRNHIEITERLSVNDILDTLFQEDIFSTDDLQKIESEKTQNERRRVFLMLLQNRGPSAYKCFLQSLIDSNQEDLAKKIDSNDKKANKQRVITLAVQNTSCKSITACSKCKGYIQKEARQPNFTLILKRHCCLVFENVVPKYIIDYLYQEEILDKDEYERIWHSKTVKDGWIELLQALTDCTNKALLSVFLESLLTNYRYIHEEIERTIRDLQIHMVDEKDYRKVESEDNMQILYKKRNDNDSFDDLNVGHVTPFNQECRKTYQQTVSNYDVDTGTSSRELEIRQQESMHILYLNKLLTQTVTSCRPSSKVLIANFDYLAELINDGLSTKFVKLYLAMRQKYARDFDMLCILEYLHAQKDLLCVNFTATGKHIDNGMKLVSRTSNPKYFTLLIFNAKTRMAITAKNTEEFQTTLEDAKMMIESDKVGCTGLAAGWISINDANFISDKMAELDDQDQNYFEDYHNLRREASRILQLAHQHFQKDNSMEKYLGTGFTICQYVILLLMCGKNGLTMGIHVPSKKDVERAGKYLIDLEESHIPLPVSFQVHYQLAKCDYHFRRNLRTRALENAKTAKTIASKLKMSEYRDYATNRVKYLKLTATDVENLQTSQLGQTLKQQHCSSDETLNLENLPEKNRPFTSVVQSQTILSNLGIFILSFSLGVFLALFVTFCVNRM